MIPRTRRQQAIVALAAVALFIGAGLALVVGAALSGGPRAGAMVVDDCGVGPGGLAMAPLAGDWTPARYEAPLASTPSPRTGTGVAWLFDTTGFPERWHCGVWTQALGWLHIVSDLGIWSAYMAIPLILGYFVFRGTTPFPGILWLFVAFIGSCGIGHLIEAVIFWEPVYRLSGVWKGVTAVASWATVLALIPIIPRVSKWPRLEDINTRLEREVRGHEEAQARLTDANTQLHIQKAELAKTMSDLERANHELERFAYITSHDLKAPLRGIASLAQWVNEDYAASLDAEGQENLRLIISRAERMNGLIDGVLRYSRALRAEPTYQKIDTARAAREAIDLIAPPENVEITLEPGLPEIVYDYTQFQQIVQNLVANAIEHRDKPSGAIRLGAVDLGEAWEFVVADNGPGIPAGCEEKIFGLFQTVRSKDEHESTGVGLAVVKSLVERNGGRVGVRCEVGQGARFSFTIPKHLTSVVDESLAAP